VNLVSRESLLSRRVSILDRRLARLDFEVRIPGLVGRSESSPPALPVRKSSVERSGSLPLIGDFYQISLILARIGDFCAALIVVAPNKLVVLPN
jgi:hypothetical protein